MIQSFEYKGEWFLPYNEDFKVLGTLNYDSNTEATLELHGDLNKEKITTTFKDEQIILGLTNEGKEITLYGCFMTTPGALYQINFILVGALLYSIEELMFNEISCEIFNLDEWVGISGFKDNVPELNDYNNLKYKVEYNPPPDLEFVISENTLMKFKFIGYHSGFSRYQKRVHIDQKVLFQISTTKGNSIRDLISLVDIFNNFLMLALYQSTHFISITLSGEKHLRLITDEIEIYNEIKLFSLILNRKQSSKIKDDFAMLFDYKRISKEFPFVIRNWYEKYPLLKPAFSLLFEQFYNDDLFTTNTFLNLAQSAETFHARLYNHTKIPKQEYDEMKKEIRQSVPLKYHSWLNEQFSYGNNLNLQTRLEEIVEKYSNEVLDQIINDKELFVKQVKKSRNYYTHYSKSDEGKALKGKDLLLLTEKLKALLVCSFLMQAGMTKEKITELIREVKWRYFNHLSSF